MYPALYEIENGEANGRVYHFCDEDVDDCRKFFLRDNPLPPQMIAGTSEPVQDSECDYCGKPLADPRDTRIAELEAALREVRAAFFEDARSGATVINGKLEHVDDNLHPWIAGGRAPKVIALIDHALNPAIELNLSDKEMK